MVDAPVERQIVEIRGQRVIVDRDLAALYGVTVKRLNQQVVRNRAKFPPEFAFRLTAQEVASLRLQSATSKGGRGGRRHAPWVFTEHGVLMAATVLQSPQAVEMSIFVIKVFVKMRERLAARGDLARRLEAIERKLLGYDAAFRKLYMKLRELSAVPTTPTSRQIGFRAED